MLTLQRRADLARVHAPVGEVVTHRGHDGTAHTRTLATHAELRAVLAGEFGLELDASARLSTPRLAALT